MKIILGLLIVLTGCGQLPAQRVRVVNMPEKGASAPVTRSDKYKNCIVELSREGIRQSLIGMLCDKTYGRID